MRVYVQGPFPSELYQLENLEHLDVSNNEMGGVLSPEVSKVRRYSQPLRPAQPSPPHTRCPAHDITPPSALLAVDWA